MSVELIARTWARPVDCRAARTSPYSAKWGSIVEMLRGELRQIGASNVIVEMDVRDADIRNDGWPRSTARPNSPGVRLTFKSRHGELCYECGMWRGWEDNIYAIARTLRAQRMIARDGAVKGDQVYRGFKALPGGGEPIQAGAFATVEAAARHLCVHGGPLPGLAIGDDLVRLVIDDADACRTVYRVAARKLHPDNGGTQADMAKVNAAKEMIEADQRRRGVA